MADTIRLLYVDDEPHLLELGKEFLEQDGEFVVDTAGSPVEARGILSREMYDAIVSDYQMPGEDGIAFLKSVRGSHGDIPFILFTGRGREEVVIDAIASGADFYIQKGGSAGAQFAELAHKIRQAVSRNQDAARRKAAEDALRESEARFALLFRNSPVGLTLVDATTNTFADVNEAFVQGTGYTRGEMIGKTPGEAGIFADPEILGEIRRLLEAGQPIPAREVRFRNRDGTIHTCLFSAVMITVHGKPYVISSTEDISRRKAMEDELRENQVLLAEAMDLAHMATWVGDRKTRAFTFNDRFWSLYGTTAEREGGYTMAIDSYIDTFVHPDDRQAVRAAILRPVPIRSGVAYEYVTDHRIVRRDGQVRYIAVRVRICKDAEGNYTKVHGVNQDVTDRLDIEGRSAPSDS